MPPVIIAIAGPLFAALTAVGISAVTAAAIVNVLAPALIYGGLSIASSMVSMLFRHTPRQIDPSRMVSVTEAAAPRRVIYGRARVAGVHTFLDVQSVGGSYNNVLQMILTLSGHPLTSIDHVYFNGNDVGHSSNWGVDPSSWWYGFAWWEGKLGTPGEASFPHLMADDGLWSTAHRQDGCGSVHIKLTWDAKHSSTVPVMMFDVHGKALYDFRTATTGYSENPALAIYDYLTSKDYGFGVNPAQINLASFIAAANICDQTVNKIGGTEPRYTCNGSFTVDMDRQTLLSNLAQCMAGYVSYSQGQWTAVAGAWTGPVISLGDDDLRGAIQVQSLRSMRDLCNGVRGKIFSPYHNWAQVDFPGVYRSQFLADDSGFIGTTQQGAWATATPYALNDCVSDVSAMSIQGVWASGVAYSINDYVTDNTTHDIYVCTQAHTSGLANEPGVGANWTSYWVDMSATIAQTVGSVFVCKLAHTSSALTEPGRGANWATYWTEATNHIWKDIDLNFTISSAAAQRIAKIELMRIRYQTQIVLRCKLNALVLTPGDVFKFSHPRFGWNGVQFQVMQCDFAADVQGDNAVLGVDIHAVMTDSSIFDWSTSEEVPLGSPSYPAMPKNSPYPSLGDGSVIPQGSIPPTFGPGMTYTSNTSSITWSWDYTTNGIDRCDGTTVSPAPVGSQAVTGLSATHTYYFYPYYDENAAALAFVAGGSGSPAWAQSAQARALTAAQSLQGHIPLSPGSGMAAATTSSGGGGGGGGGDGGCLYETMFVRERHRGVIRANEVHVGNFLWSDDGEWVEVLAVESKPHDLWCVLEFCNGAYLIVTTGHPFTRDDNHEAVRACDLTIETPLSSPTGVCYPTSIRILKKQAVKIPISLKEPHVFYASADGEHWVLTHNYIQNTY
jgi:hypothetical protein